MKTPHDLILELSYLALPRVIRFDVPDMVLGQVVDGLLNGLHAARDSHGRGGEVGVSPRPVPVARHRLGVEADHHTEILGYALQQITSHPQVI